MLTRFSDIERTFAAMDHLRRRMDRILDEDGAAPGGDFLRATFGDELERRGRLPRMTIADGGTTLMVRAEVPGFAEKDVQLSIHQDTLTMSGERKTDAPAGYFVHRQERLPIKFARSFALPCKVDPEQSAATLKDGVLTVTLTKAPEAQPRQIAVKVS